MTDAELETLRYPIGRREQRAEYSTASRNASIDDIAALPASVRQIVAALADTQLDTPYRRGGWTVRQVVHHVADAHLVLYVRARIALTEDNPSVKVWDEVTWAELPDARTMPIDASLSILDAVHARFVHLLARLTPEQFGRTMQHPMWGVVPIDELVEICAWHGRHHAAHIRTLRKRNGW